MRFRNKGGSTASERAVPSRGKRGPPLRSIGLLASRARLTEEDVCFPLVVKGYRVRERQIGKPRRPDRRAGTHPLCSENAPRTCPCVRRTSQACWGGIGKLTGGNNLRRSTQDSDEPFFRFIRLKRAQVVRGGAFSEQRGVCGLRLFGGTLPPHPRRGGTLTWVAWRLCCKSVGLCWRATRSNEGEGRAFRGKARPFHLLSIPLGSENAPPFRLVL